MNDSKTLLEGPLRERVSLSFLGSVLLSGFPPISSGHFLTQDMSSQSQQDYRQARREEHKGRNAKNSEKVKEKGRDMKADIKEAFGRDASDDRTKAREHEVKAETKKLEHDAKATGYRAKGKGEEIIGK